MPLRILAMVALCLLLAACAKASPGKHNVDLWFPDHPEAWPLAVAAEEGNAREVRRQMKDQGINPDTIFTKDGTPLLAWPIIAKSPAGLKAMLENGADPDAAILHPMQHTERFKGRIKNNTMVWAAKDDDPIYLKLLLDHGGDPNTRNSNGETLLLQARLMGNQWHNVTLLVERGADVNAKSQGSTILVNYAWGGGFMQTYWLLEHGAGPSDRMPNPPEFDDVVAAIFWHPGNPKNHTWQRRCQQWLLQRGYQRPPMPVGMYKIRAAFGFPTEETEIPLL